MNPSFQENRHTLVRRLATSGWWLVTGLTLNKPTVHSDPTAFYCRMLPMLLVVLGKECLVYASTCAQDKLTFDVTHTLRVDQTCLRISLTTRMRASVQVVYLGNR